MLLETQGVTTRFGGLVAVDSVSFALDSGEILGLIGPNGAGKTTLFNTVSGVFRPNRGSVKLEGSEIAGMSPHLIARRGLARTFQISRPFGELSVLDNVVVGAWLRASSRQEAQEVALHALERVNFATRAQVPAQDLTAAERKRLDLARCLATKPSVLLVDEVIAGCTEVEMEEILETLRSLREERVAIMMVEHVLRAVMSVCDRILVMANGRIVAEGSPNDIRRNPRAIEVYLGGESTDEGEESEPVAMTEL